MLTQPGAGRREDNQIAMALRPPTKEIESESPYEARILLMTFARRAAGEMSRRVGRIAAAALGVDASAAALDCSGTLCASVLVLPDPAPGASLAFQNVCHWPRGLNTHEPVSAVTTSSSNKAPSVPVRTHEYSSSRRCRCIATLESVSPAPEGAGPTRLSRSPLVVLGEVPCVTVGHGAS